MTCWYSLETSLHEEFKYEIVILILYHPCESVYIQTQTGKCYFSSSWFAHIALKEPEARQGNLLARIKFGTEKIAMYIQTVKVLTLNAWSSFIDTTKQFGLATLHARKLFFICFHKSNKTVQSTAYSWTVILKPYSRLYFTPIVNAVNINIFYVENFYFLPMQIIGL